MERAGNSEKDKSLKYSMIIPLYNEEENVGQLHERLIRVLSSMGREYEVIYIDDGSMDGTFEKLKEIAGGDNRVRVIRLRRNFGQTAALSAGFRHARGEVIITSDGDLQNDPEDIPRLLTKLEEGYDMVSGWRKERKDPFWSRILPSLIANKIIAGITGVNVHDMGCSLKAYRRDLIRHINLYGEMHRFLPVLASWVGASIAEIPVSHHPRCHGKSKYGLSRTFRVILDLITVKFLLSYSTRPIQIFGAWGLASIFLGLLSGIATILMRIITIDGNPIRTMTRNPLLWATGIFIIVGIQFIILGLLGEVNIRTYYESQNKPIYLVREFLNK